MIPTNVIRTVKDQGPKSSLDTILTGSLSTISAEPQNACIWSWQGKAKRVIASGMIDITPYQGLTSSLDPSPSLAKVLTSYTVKIPGGEVFMICNPDIRITDDQKPIFDFARNSGLEFSWGASLILDGQTIPSAFILSASALPYIIRYIPTIYGMDGEGWRKWLHEHLGKVMGHKYFDGSRFNLISPWQTNK